jgi:proteasome lid subunit RPN8/RPN11
MGGRVTLLLGRTLLERIQEHGEQAYPEEGAGFLLGMDNTDGGARTVMGIVSLQNAREAGSRGNRYLITPEDYLSAELQAEEQGLELIGVYHSHPDHPDLPSDFDREWAQPQFSYLITRVFAGTAEGSRAWKLSDDRVMFTEEEIRILRFP